MSDRLEELKVFTQTQDQSLSAKKYTVSAIVHTNNTLFDRIGFVSLSQGQWLADIEDGATEILLYNTVNVASSSIKQDQEYISAWRDNPSYASILKATGFINYCLLVSVMLAATLCMLNITLLYTHQERHNIAILRSLGLSQAKLMSMIIGELFFIINIGTLLGASIALLILSFPFGFALGESLQQAAETLPMNNIIYPKLAAHRLELVWLLIMGSGLIGTLYPIWKACTVSPVRILQENH